MNYVLDVQNAGKRYASYRSNLHRFATWFGANIQPTDEYWANTDISFSVRPGEALALIGQNGAGKSTLLKMITGTVRPTTGTIGLKGRISAILELGLGFNPEFTGRENILHAGGLMGYSREELIELMPSIEAFAEIGEFFNQPIRVYSSGMQARLAFALATAKRPEILIVDEVLSVGDSYFQHKSFDKIRQFKEDGTSILLVTHSLGDVRALCDRVILLDKGRVLKDGLPDEVVDYYNALIAERENANMVVEQERKQNGWLQTRSGTFEVQIDSIKLLDGATLEQISTARLGQQLLLKLVAHSHRDIPRLVLGYMLRDRTGHIIWGTNTWHTKQPAVNINANERIEYELLFTCSLGPGTYSFSPTLVSSDTHLENNFEWVDNALVFEVVNVDKPFFLGTSWLDAEFTIKKESVMFISYAQNFEDVILWRALKHVEKGVYVDIGAQDPIIDSVSRGFYEKGWRGVHVEPTATYAQKLRENRPDELVLQVAIGMGNDALRFFEIPETGLSTGDSIIAQEHRERDFEVIETEVPLLPLAKLFDEIEAHDIHWLKIDVEGMEKSVLESWLPSQRRPWIVVAESTRPLQEESTFEDWDYLLIDKGYEFVYFDGLNRFYVSEEHRELENAFGPGPNIFDNFTVSGDASSPLAVLLKDRIHNIEERVNMCEEHIEEHKKNNNILISQLEKTENKNKDLALINNTLLMDMQAVSTSLIHTQSEMAEKVHFLNVMEHELSRIYSSYSWRITAPLRDMNYLTHWFMRGALAWWTLKPGSRPRRFIHSFITHAMLWIRRRPKIFTAALRIVHLFPSLERRLFAAAHARGLGLSYSPAPTGAVQWELDVEPQVIEKWQRILK